MSCRYVFLLALIHLSLYGSDAVPMGTSDQSSQTSFFTECKQAMALSGRMLKEIREKRERETASSTNTTSSKPATVDPVFKAFFEKINENGRLLTEAVASATSKHPHLMTDQEFKNFIEDAEKKNQQDIVEHNKRMDEHRASFDIRLQEEQENKRARERAVIEALSENARKKIYLIAGALASGFILIKILDWYFSSPKNSKPRFLANKCF